MYYGTGWDWATLLGSVGLFSALLFLFIRVLPMISIYELRELVKETGGGKRTPDLMSATPPTRSKL
jgi:molybdopterin-containing oxidoreductase family membrane subunit